MRAAKFAWITVTVLALSAERSAVAQSAPARSGNASDATRVRVEPSSASVGPQLAAARANTGTPVNFSSLASRQAAAGNAVPSALVLPSGAGAPIQSNAGGADLQTLHGDATGATPTAAGLATRVVPDLQQGGAATTAPAPHSEAVIRGQINPAAKACYENDPDSKSKQPGRLVILIRLTAAGEIDAVTVASNTGLSPSVTSCITTAAHAAKFAAPGANGATVRAAFSFGKDDQAPSPGAARAKGAQAANASGRAAHDTIAKADTRPTNGESPHR